MRIRVKSVILNLAAKAPLREKSKKKSQSKHSIKSYYSKEKLVTMIFREYLYHFKKRLISLIHNST